MNPNISVSTMNGHGLDIRYSLLIRIGVVLQNKSYVKRVNYPKNTGGFLLGVKATGTQKLPLSSV